MVKRQTTGLDLSEDEAFVGLVDYGLFGEKLPPCFTSERLSDHVPERLVSLTACLEHVGTVLSLMDRMASCWWVCKGGDHKVERLCGKVASNARGALRLLRFGFYDESLTLCRAMGEISNLLYLFVLDKDALEEWRADHRDKLPPVDVRRKIEKLNEIVPVNQKRYQQLSELVHVNPNTSPQSYNLLEIPTLGAHQQDEGILLCLNELALPLGVAAFSGVSLLDLKHEIKKKIFLASRKLCEQIGGVTIVELATITDSRRSAK